MWESFSILRSLEGWNLSHTKGGEEGTSGVLDEETIRWNRLNKGGEASLYASELE